MRTGRTWRCARGGELGFRERQVSRCCNIRVAEWKVRSTRKMVVALSKCSCLPTTRKPYQLTPPEGTCITDSNEVNGRFFSEKICLLLCGVGALGKGKGVRWGRSGAPANGASRQKLLGPSKMFVFFSSSDWICLGRGKPTRSCRFAGHPGFRSTCSY
jgi:hypothetical protein